MVVDTSVFIDAARGRGPAGQWLTQTTGDDVELLVSTVTIAEYAAGIKPDRLSQELAYLLSLSVLPVTSAIAIRAGEIRYVLARRGRALALPDAPIAATVLDSEAMLVTLNGRDFTIDGLRVVAPSVDAAP
jgi:predicted nucleic acid-binding protein